MVPEVDKEQELLAKIRELESLQESRQEERQELAPAAREAEKKFHNLEAVLQQVRDSYNAAALELNQKNSRIREIDSATKNDKLRLEQLKRERDRLLDAKAINEKYLAQVEEFKNKCLNAAWRKENRTDGLGAKPHQIDGAVHLAITQRALLGDPRGLGKTLTSLVTTDLLDAQKLIVVTPADTVKNWVRELNLWTPHRLAVPMKKFNKAERTALLGIIRKLPQWALVTNYEAWAADYDVIKELVNLTADTLILDESHHIMTMKSLQNRGVQDIRYGVNTCPRCLVPMLHEKVGLREPVLKEYSCWCGHKGPLDDFLSIKNVIEMSGTPILNKPQELYPQLRLIDIENFPSEKLYLRDFCVRDKETGRWYWSYGGEKRVTKILGPRYLARTRDAAGVILPPVGEIQHTIDMDELKERYPRQHEAYWQIHKYAEIALNPDYALPMPNQVAALMRLRQVLVWPAALQSKMVDEHGKQRIINLNVEESWRIDLAAEKIRELNEEGERCIVFSQFRGGLDELARRLGPRTAVYHGDVSERVRDQIQLDFDVKTAPVQPRWDNVCAVYKSGGTGLNFNTATHMFMLDLEWNPGKEDQATGRMDRMGQTRDMYVHKFYVSNSVDYWMQEIIDMKAEMVEGFMSQAELMQSAFDKLRNGEM